MLQFFKAGGVVRPNLVIKCTKSGHTVCMSRLDCLLYECMVEGPVTHGAVFLAINAILYLVDIKLANTCSITVIYILHISNICH